ncbi:hypothetical protein SBV1_30042 [Verrucomicrobia bacterium]|nr:hypothetical protein SBV1_30042 [Verrucomicrobiota bacterium]
MEDCGGDFGHASLARGFPQFVLVPADQFSLCADLLVEQMYPSEGEEDGEAQAG